MADSRKVEQLRELFHTVEEMIPFNRFLGLHADSIDADGVVIHLDFNYSGNSSSPDAPGGTDG